MRKIIPSLILVLVFSSFVCATYVLDEYDHSFTAIQGEKLSSQFTITNTDTTDIEFSFPNKFNLTGYASEINIDFGESTIVIRNGTEKNITYSFSLPEYLYAGNHDGQFEIVSNETNATFTIDVNLADSIELSVPSELDFGEVYPNKTESRSIAITNTGNKNLTDVKINNNNGKYGLEISPTEIDVLVPGQTININFEVLLPLGTDAEENVDMGDLLIESTQKDFSFENFFSLDIMSFLNLDEIDISIDNEKDTIKESGERIEDEAKPMQTVQMDVKVENFLETKADLEIEIDDVEVEITIFGIDDGDDIELSSESISLDFEGSEKEHTFKFEFDIPTKVDDSDYDIEIILTGTDDEDNDYEVIWETVLEVKRESHELIIQEYSIEPNEIDCDNGNIILDFEILNLGKSDEDYVRYTLKNSELGIDTQRSRFEILSDYDDEENIYEESIPIKLNNPEEGSYPIELRVYRDFDILEDILTRNLIINECGTEPEESIEEEEEIDEPEEKTEVEKPVEKIEEPKKTKIESLLERIVPRIKISESPTLLGTKVKNTLKDFKESDNYTITLLAISIILIAGMVLLLVAHKKK